ERDGLARLVGQWGYEVETAGSGEEALSLVESQHPAVVVTDLVLPEMDGLTLLEKLKETGRPPIVLLVTGQGTVETAAVAMRRGGFTARAAPARSWLRVRSTSCRTGATSRSSPSTARRSRKRSSRASCSGTSEEPSPAPPNAASAASSWRTAVRCFSMRSRRW